MRFEQKHTAGERGNWYEIDILPAPGANDEFYILVGWGPPDLVLQDKREVYKGSIDNVLIEIEKIRNRIEKAGYVRLDDTTEDTNA